MTSDVDRPTNPIAPTSRWMAAARARESERADRLFYDPLAAALAGPDGFAWLERMESAARSDGPGLYPVIRTRFFDDFLMDACRGLGVRQVVLAAAGLDTRAFRLTWPPHVYLYEMDLPEVLDAKEQVIEAAGAKASCERRTVRVDLREATWPEALLASGYQPERPSVWLIEGLLYYLTRTAVHRLLEKVGALTATGSLLGLDVMNRGLFFSLVTWPLQAALARLGAPGRFGTNDPEKLMARHGWEADVTQPGEEGANFGRWPRPMIPR
ncbi:MAG: SAM-dependent methyltransferase, partial [Actinomycetota bacterium]|nr:SAM-dependent methyltransferase [Actinomycetota bacterium]